MIIIYWLFCYVILPFIPLYLFKKARKNREYKYFWSERFMFGSIKNLPHNVIWIHSVSVGETRAIQKMIELFTLNNPTYKILITVMTPTGRDTAKKMYPNCMIRYIPYDVLHIMNKFINNFNPKICILMETEIWPTLIYLSNKKNIPVVLANARLSNKSFNSYYKFRFFVSGILDKINLILCQDQQTKINFTKLTLNKNIYVTGNTKFDLVQVHNTQEFFYFKKNLMKKVVILASSRDGEEELFINAIKFIDNILFIIVPRHPERFLLVEDLLTRYKIKYQKRTDNFEIKPDTKVFLGDSMGEMFNYYAMSDIAIIGGSFLNYGGQNPIEPIFLKVPVIFGTSMFNFNEIATNILALDCGIGVNNFSECADVIIQVLNNNHLYNVMQDNCSKFIEKYSGASDLNFKHCQKFL